MVVWSSYRSVINPHDILQKWITEKDSLSTKTKLQQRKKSDNTANEIWREDNEVIEEIADPGNVDPAPTGQILDMQPGQLSAGELMT